MTVLDQPAVLSARRFVLSRRAVLATGVGVTVVGSALPAQARPARRRRPVIGVLTPSAHGSRAATLRARGDAFVAGLEAGLGGAQRSLLRAEVIGGYSGAAAAAERLIDRGAVVVVACLSESKAAELAEVCRRRKVALVMAGVGAQVAEVGAAERAPGATVLRTSSQHWQNSLSVGGWAARSLGRTLHHVVAAPDAGYDSVFALRRGFTGAGGTVVGLSLTHEGAGLGSLVAEVKKTRPAVVAISASGPRTAQIARALRGAGVRARFVLDPTAADSTAALAAFKGAADGAHLGRTQVDEKRLAALAAALRRRRAGAPTAASILGHDTGALLVAGLERLGRRPWRRLPARLAGASVAGIRGRQQVDARGQVSVPLTVVKVRKKSGRRRVVVVAKRPRIGAQAPAMAVVSGRLASGYVNEYATS